MGRPIKQGLEFFPHPIGLWENTNVRILRTRFGSVAYSALNLIYEKAYGEAGYYLKLGEDEMCLLAKDLDIEVDVLRDIIQQMIGKKIFDEKKYQEFQILTSKEMQEKYFHVCKTRGRVIIDKNFQLAEVPEGITILSEDDLLVVSQITGVFSEVTRVYPKKTWINSRSSTHSKEKNSISSRNSLTVQIAKKNKKRLDA